MENPKHKEKPGYNVFSQVVLNESQIKASNQILELLKGFQYQQAVDIITEIARQLPWTSVVT